MAIALLVRHGRTTANANGLLAGRSPGVHLDETGQAQARELAERIGVVPISRFVTSPLVRCRETAAALAGHQASKAGKDAVSVDSRLTECGYGSWTGRPLKELAKQPLWKQIQAQPSSVTFPDGESMRAMQARAVKAVRGIDAEVEAADGPDAVWVVVSHADVIKSVLADALGMHLDQFQRIAVDPASVSVVRYTPVRSFVLRMNDLGSDLRGLRPPKRRRRRASSDAVVGGGAGPDRRTG
ncbi:MAG: MSMEG_4193 family putative phosphomutase [Propionibacteriales bacterium]|nr:MSMEG_4193 family putative phosphomutase [Propionibacteriales bacterium]